MKIEKILKCKELKKDEILSLLIEIKKSVIIQTYFNNFIETEKTLKLLLNSFLSLELEKSNIKNTIDIDYYTEIILYNDYKIKIVYQNIINYIS